MKVAFLRTDDLTGVASRQEGGSYSHVGGFVRAVHRLGHPVFFIASGQPSDIRDGSAPLYLVPYPRFFRGVPDVSPLAYNYRLLPRALRILRREQPDVIYQRYSAFNYCGVVLSRMLRIPLILEVNNSEVWLQANWGRLYLTHLCRVIEEIVFWGADVLIVVSEVLKRNLVQMGLDPAKIVVNPNGVDAQTFHPDVDGSEIRARHGLLSKVVVGFLGTFGVWHGVPILTEAIRPCIAMDPRLHFLLIGDGNLRSELECQIHEEGLESSVTLVGMIPHHEVPRYLAACDILISPHVPPADGSEFFGSPTKLFEYMAMGKGIVASLLGQIGEVLRDGDSAILVKPSDPKALAGGILRLASDATLRAQLGRRAREVVTAKYTWQRNAERVVEVARQLLGRKQ